MFSFFFVLDLLEINMDYINFILPIDYYIADVGSEEQKENVAY